MEVMEETELLILKMEQIHYHIQILWAMRFINILMEMV